MGSPRVALRRVGIVFGGTALVVFTASLVAPIGPGAVGATFCYPILGPVSRFDPSSSDSVLALIRAHEEAHAQQCRRDGALWHTLHRLVPWQRVLSEAEAYCAEVRYGIANGGQARLLYAEVLDELRERTWFRRFSTAALTEALASRCPAIARTAAREEAEWQVWLKARRPH